MITIRKINIKNLPCYFFNDMINIKNFDPNLLIIQKTFKSALLFTTLNISRRKVLTM